ncbi:hypothetical protein T02_5388 [Trichinella nativa]|uniref:Uncharacterized protein n=1 Tax=Trichinella nativa TaxID=6335 RepID=A0A0V1LHW2_9BILA|nr:hypothetical protein T02_5388 [Trichinella nativa]
MFGSVISTCFFSAFEYLFTVLTGKCCMRGQLRILAFRTLPVAFIHLCNRDVDLIVNVRYDPEKLS